MEWNSLKVTQPWVNFTSFRVRFYSFLQSDPLFTPYGVNIFYSACIKANSHSWSHWLALKITQVRSGLWCVQTSIVLYRPTSVDASLFAWLPVLRAQIFARAKLLWKTSIIGRRRPMHSDEVWTNLNKPLFRDCVTLSLPYHLRACHFLVNFSSFLPNILYFFRGQGQIESAPKSSWRQKLWVHW